MKPPQFKVVCPAMTVFDRAVLRGRIDVTELSLDFVSQGRLMPNSGDEARDLARHFDIENLRQPHPGDDKLPEK